MSMGIRVILLALAATIGLADVGRAQTNYFFRHADMPDPPPPAGLDGNWYTDLVGDPNEEGGKNWYNPINDVSFIPDYSFDLGERAFIENGGTAFVDSDGGIYPGQIVLGSAGGTSGTLEIQSGGVMHSRMRTDVSINGNVNVGSAGGSGTLRVLPGGTLTAEGQLVQGTNSANSIRVGGPTGGTATLSAAGATLPRAVHVFPNADFSVTGGAGFSSTSNFTSEITGNGTAGSFDVGSNATIAGTLNLSFNAPYAPAVGHNWNVLEANAVNGNFSTVTHNVNLAGNQNFIVSKPDVGERTAVNVSLQEVLVLEVNRNTGAASIKHPGSGNILTDGYFVGSTVGSLSPAGRMSVNGQGTMGNDWVDTDATPFNVGELKVTHDGTVPGGNVANISLGSIFDAAAGSFGQFNEDLVFSYRRSSDGAQFPGRVQYVGDKFNTLVLHVDPDPNGSGAVLHNPTDTTVEIDEYHILSEDGSLSVAGWDSFDDQNLQGAGTWLEILNASANQIGEFNASIANPALTISPGASFSLGNLFNGGTQDLDFNFLLFGEQTNLSGLVVYEPFAAADGDYNNDGVVDAADYTVWRDTGGTPQQFAAWKQNFGAGSGSGAALASAAAVPEPASWLLALLAIAACGIRRQR